MSHKKALVMVDLQNDFLPGGSMGVAHAEVIIPLINRLQDYFDLVVATQDWHPADHTSFAINHPGRQLGETIQIGELQQVLWPVHCVQDTPGSDFHPALDLSRIARIFHKGIDKKIDSYSAFFDNAHLRSTGLANYLHKEGVKQVYLAGLVTDYCVKYSSLDAIHQGFEVFVIQDACRGIDLNAGDVEQALKEMSEAGVQLIHSNDVFLANR